MKFKVLDIRQTSTRSWFVLEGDEHWEVIAKRPALLYSRTRFDVYLDKKLQYTLMQTSRWKQLLEPLLIFYQNPFSFFRDGVCCGTWRLIREKVPYQWDFVFDGATYRFTPGNRKDRHYILKNGERFADYHCLGRGNYEIDCTEEASSSPDLLILFAAYAQVYLRQEKIWL